ncbi:hypothetical protein D9M72_386820 [compost metagenome]
MRAARFHAFFPRDAQPFQRLKQLLVAFFRVPRRVRVLDAEHKRALRVPGVGPVEQRRTDQAHVRGAGGRWAEPHPDRGFGGDGRTGDSVGHRRSSHSDSNFTACPGLGPAAKSGTETDSRPGIPGAAAVTSVLCAASAGQPGWKAARCLRSPRQTGRRPPPGPRPQACRS